LKSIPKILLSARDPAGVGNVIPLAQYFKEEGFDVQIAASEPAAGILHSMDINVIKFEIPHVQHKKDASLLNQMSRELLQTVSPDAVIVSLSSFGAGIDEALLATAEVPTFAVQDFWGDVNLTLDVPAGLYFVIDDYAVRLSKERWGVKAVAVGGPKYTLYSQMDILSMRRKGRYLAGVGKNECLVGWFGQSPEIPGHEDVFLDMIQAFSGLSGQRCKLLLREHPKFLEAHYAHMGAINDLGIDAFDATENESSEQWLAACDVVITPFSLCGLDHAYLSAFSPIPIGTVLYAMTNPEIRDFSQQIAGFVRFPILERGLGSLVRDAAEFKNYLQRSLQPQVKETYFELSKQMRMENSLNKIYQYVINTLKNTE